MRVFVGVPVLAPLLVPLAVWTCVGISAIDSVCACSPPRSPSVWPLPTWIGVRLRRSGSPKLTRPSPPKVVPSSENSAWFWLIGSSCPSVNAHPLGGNTNDIILISESNGSAMCPPLYHRLKYAQVIQSGTTPPSRHEPARGARNDCRSAHSPHLRHACR